jgi:hypothetical protein
MVGISEAKRVEAFGQNGWIVMKVCVLTELKLLDVYGNIMKSIIHMMR